MLKGHELVVAKCRRLTDGFKLTSFSHFMTCQPLTKYRLIIQSHNMSDWRLDRPIMHFWMTGLYLSVGVECTLMWRFIVFKNPNLLFGKFRHAVVLTCKLVIIYLSIKDFPFWPSSEEADAGFKKREFYGKKTDALKGLSYAFFEDQSEKWNVKKVLIKVLDLFSTLHNWKLKIYVWSFFLFKRWAHA